MTANRSIALGLLAVTAAGAPVMLLDVGGAVRNVVALVFVLIGPGLALSLPMGPMSIEARALVAVAGSAALTTLVSLVLLWIGSWSGGLGFGVLAVFVVALAAHELRRPSSAVPPPPSTPSPRPESSTADIRA